MKGYRVNGTREMVEVGTEALDALNDFLGTLGEDAELAEFRVYENMAVEAVVYHDNAFETYLWTRAGWVWRG